MHGWMAYSHQSRDEATFRGELELVVGSGAVPYIYEAHACAHVSICCKETNCLGFVAHLWFLYRLVHISVPDENKALWS